jgi:hypothetical protein
MSTAEPSLLMDSVGDRYAHHLVQPQPLPPQTRLTLTVVALFSP